MSNTLFAWMLTIAAAALLIAIPSIWPYSYYIALRWLVATVCLIGTYKLLQAKRGVWATILVLFALVFNPIVPLTLSKLIWVYVDIVTAVMLFSLRFDVMRHEV